MTQVKSIEQLPLCSHWICRRYVFKLFNVLNANIGDLINNQKFFKKYSTMIKQKQPQKIVVVTELDDNITKLISKKIRNLTKKINDIETLEKKTDHKPEQLDKIRNKPNILEERRKNEEFLKYYKIVVAQNQEKTTTISIAAVASALTIHQSIQKGTQFPTLTAQQTSIIEGLLPQVSNDGTLSDYYQKVTNNLDLLSNSHADLSKKIVDLATDGTFNIKFVHKAEQTQITTTEVKAQQPIVQQQVPQTPVLITPVITQAVVEPVVEAVVQVLVTPTVETPVVVVPVTTVVQQPTKQTIQTTVTTATTVATTETIVVASKTPVITNESNTENVPPQTKGTYKKPYNRKQYNNKPYNKPYNKGEYQGRPYNNTYNNTYHTKKYAERKEERRDSDTSLSSSEEREYQRREFKKSEVRQLENDGFKLVGKKPIPQVRKYREKQI